MGLNICPNCKELLEGFESKQKRNLRQMGDDELVVHRKVQDENFDSAIAEKAEGWKENLGQKLSEVSSSPQLDHVSKLMMEKWGSLSHELMLDMLSENEKQKLIANLVKLQHDGTVEVDLEKSSPVVSELSGLQSFEESTVSRSVNSESKKSAPWLQIAILVVGTRGDVQPFLAIAKKLQEYGHHVRLATHADFGAFVKSSGVDFYPLGGDPRALARYMVRNRGLIPSGPTEVSIQRKQLKAIIDSLLPACTAPDLETGTPFRAQAIIANPTAYGHAHVAEALGVPLHIFFTMPWTQANI